ncbi:DUF3717 domain-containing protein [Amphibiibacter pelophylacis]|uniref:DUF3717 domain-containing protein n=1 Tax=Amphibiibacter pelophylacis TaxID=1799477 RepID=A0ACC6P4H8_9BURK
MAPLHLHDLEAAINWWRQHAPSSDGISACAPVRALAEVYARMVWQQQDAVVWSALPGRAQAAWTAWYQHQSDAPCIAICSTAQGDPVCKGCGRTEDEVQHWTRMEPLDKRAVWRRITAEGTAWRFNKYAERVVPARQPGKAEIEGLLGEF